MSQEALKALVLKETCDAIDTWIAKYPADKKESAVMAALMLVQEEKGHLTETLMKGVADYLEMDFIAVLEVATFYSMYNLEQKGKHCLEVCTNVSCRLRGAKDVVKHISETLDINVGETTKDGKFHLKAVECLGSCCGAPMMQIGKKYYENLDPKKIDEILAEF